MRTLIEITIFTLVFSTFVFGLSLKAKESRDKCKQQTEYRTCLGI